MALAAEGNLRDAIEQFKTTAQLRPDFAGIYFELGKAQAALGLYDDAIKSFQTEIANSDDYNTELALANAYERKGMHDKAVEALERAKKLKGEKSPLLYHSHPPASLPPLPTHLPSPPFPPSAL